MDRPRAHGIGLCPIRTTGPGYPNRPSPLSPPWAGGLPRYPLPYPPHGRGGYPGTPLPYPPDGKDAGFWGIFLVSSGFLGCLFAEFPSRARLSRKGAHLGAEVGNAETPRILVVSRPRDARSGTRWRVSSDRATGSFGALAASEPIDPRAAQTRHVARRGDARGVAREGLDLMQAVALEEHEIAGLVAHRARLAQT